MPLERESTDCDGVRELDGGFDVPGLAGEFSLVFFIEASGEAVLMGDEDGVVLEVAPMFVVSG